MSSKRRIFSGRDTIALVVSLLLAFSVWLIHNLSLDYSMLMHCTLVPSSRIEGHAEQSVVPAEVAARCEVSGFEILSSRFTRKGGVPVSLEVEPEDLHQYVGDTYYMTGQDVTRYFHEIFGEKAKLEYFVTDTLLFNFPSILYRKVPVSLVHNFSFRSQYMAVGQLRLEPDSVCVYAEREALEAIDAVATEIVRVENLDADLFGEADIIVPEGARLSAEKVSYTMPVARYVEHELSLPVRVADAPDSIRIQVLPSKATVRLKTYASLREEPDEVSVSVDYGDFASSISGRVMGRVENLPSGVISVEVIPEVFDCIVVR